MSSHPILEMTLGKLEKQPIAKVRWEMYIDKVLFTLYIEKWRVPTPWPRKIRVIISPRRIESDDSPNLTKTQIIYDPSLAYEPIVATVKTYEKHTKTLRYSPVGNPADREIWGPYIPYSLTHGEADRIRLIIQWV